MTTPTFPAVVFSVTDAGIADLREGLEALLLSWNVEVKEAA
jgi:hypothetical protein